VDVYTDAMRGIYNLHRLKFRYMAARYTKHGILSWGLNQWDYRILKSLLPNRPPDTSIPKLRCRLAEVYQKDLSTLEDLLERPLTHWLS